MLSSCSTTYNPNTLFTPYPMDKGDLAAEASIGTGDLSTFASYGISNKYGVMAGVQLRSLVDGNATNTWYSESGFIFTQPAQIIYKQQILGGFSLITSGDPLLFDKNLLMFNFGARMKLNLAR